jgi:hypothetical protein
LLARHLGIGSATVAISGASTALRQAGRDVQVLHRPRAGAKVINVVGLYLAPPENAVVLCLDEKSQIQALDRTAPMLPIQPGLPARRTHDHVRHGPSTVFAALGIATDTVTAAGKPRHRHQEFLAFLRQVAHSAERRIDCKNVGEVSQSG